MDIEKTERSEIFRQWVKKVAADGGGRSQDSIYREIGISESKGRKIMGKQNKRIIK